MVKDTGDRLVFVEGLEDIVCTRDNGIGVLNARNVTESKQTRDPC